MGEFQLETRGSLGEAPAVAVFHAADGSLVAEVNPPIGNAALSRLVTKARREGISAIWASGVGFSAHSFGFRRRRGYARLQAIRPLRGAEAAQPPLSTVPDLQVSCYAHVWGHHHPGDEADPDATYVGLYESGAWIGICEVELERSTIESPGLMPPFRTPDRYAQLVRDAVSMLAPGLVTLETWGDSEETIDAYRGLGFELVEYVPGWELVVTASR
jgi:hypothetical protein